MSDKKWAWQEAFADVAHGPFDSREDALVHAREWLGVNGAFVATIIFGPVIWASPSQHVPCDIEAIKEQMEESAVDDEFLSSDPVFVCCDKQKAQSELRLLMRKWAIRHFKPDFWKLDEQERLTLRSHND
jgi:hypothetical protein